MAVISIVCSLITVPTIRVNTLSCIYYLAFSTVVCSRIIRAVLGTFNTMGNVTVYGKTPLLDDYKGSMSNKMVRFLKSGKFPIDGEKDKAM